MRRSYMLFVLLGVNGMILLATHMIYVSSIDAQRLSTKTRNTSYNHIKIHDLDYEQIMQKYPFLKQGNETKRRFPSAIIIGVRKGGTAALRSFLGKHPLVVIIQTEGHFFDLSHYEKGYEFYRSLMPISKPGQITVEKTPSYIRKTLVPERIRLFNPKIKLIIILREPVSRLISDYVHNAQYKNRREATTPFEKVFFWPSGELKREHRILLRGVYTNQVRKWFENFHRSQILILDASELVHNPYKTLHKTERFLGLPQFFSAENFFFNEDKGFFCYKDKKRHHCLPRNKGRNYPNISQRALQVVKDFYKPHNQELVKLLGRNFSWTV